MRSIAAICDADSKRLETVGAEFNVDEDRQGSEDREILRLCGVNYLVRIGRGLYHDARSTASYRQGMTERPQERQ